MSKVNVVTASLSPRLRLGLVASQPIDKGEVVLRCSEDEVQRERTWRTLQVGYGRHLKNEILDYIDHSCAPNVAFDVDKLEFVAMRAIAPQEPITLFYPGAEVELAQDFVCHCGSAECLGHLYGGFYLSREQVGWALDRGYCTRFMREQFKRVYGL